MGWIDLIALMMVCGTTVTCFIIRAGHGTDIEELEGSIRDLESNASVLSTSVDAIDRRLTSAADVLQKYGEHIGKLEKHMTGAALGRR